MTGQGQKEPGAEDTERQEALGGPKEKIDDGAGVDGQGTAQGGSLEQPQAGAPPRQTPMPIVAIGASAGGLEALQEFFSNCPPESGIAFVVVTHVRPGRDSILPELLGAITKMDVFSAGDNSHIERNKVIVARDVLLSVSGGVLRTVKAEATPETSYHPIDHFFRSLADDQREHAIGIVLSGSGNDGALGIKAIKAAGGMVMVQTPETAKYTGMPDSAIATHLADYILPPKALPAALVEYCRGPYLQLVRRVEVPALPESAIQAILVRLRTHSGQDFTCYKKSTMSRRIQRRMNVHHIDEPQAYLAFLRENPHEIDALLEELLISVTSFFRDPPAWKALAEEAIPRLLDDRPDGQQLRVWVPGCATGEEAYSVAIILEEQIRRSERTHPVQIFATDLDERAIDVARAGLYPEGVSADVSVERLKTFFSRQDGAYRIHKSIRDTIVFAQQNVISDPPFTRLDLIVCRNVLIYLDAGVQQHVLPNFHYALRPGGLLFLGSAEAVGEASDLFEVINGKYKILRRKDITKPVHPMITHTTIRRTPGEPVEPEDRSPRAQLQFSKRVEQLLLDRFVPCSILVDERGTVMHVQGRSGMFLEPEQGPPRNNVLEMAREGLAANLAACMRQARQEQREIVRSGIRVRTNGGHTSVDLNVVPLKEPEAFRNLFLLTLRPSPVPSDPGAMVEPAVPDNIDRIDLERELQHTRENLQTTIEELETSNEELKSSNEELQSTNEELQSTNEELETSKEEMQSLNEELNTVNSELQAKLEALARTNDDMNNLLNSMQVATIFLDTRLRVKRYTEQARDVVRLISTDIGRPLSDLTSILDYSTLIQDCERVLTTLIPLEREVQNTAGQWYLIRLMPYRTAENFIEGLVMIIVDINRTKQAEESLRRNEQGLQADLDAVTTLHQVGSLFIRENDIEMVLGKVIDAAIGISGADFGYVETLDPRTGHLRIVASRSLPQWWLDYWNQAPVGEGASTEALQKRERVMVEDVQQSPLFEGKSSLDVQNRAGVRAIVCTPLFGRSGNPIGVLSVHFKTVHRQNRHKLQRLDLLARQAADIIERKAAEEKLHYSEEKYRLLFESIEEGFCIIEVIFDERDNPVDYRFQEINPSFARQTGLTDPVGKSVREIIPRHEDHWFQIFGRIARTGKPERFENRAAGLGRWYEVCAWRYGRPEDRQIAVLFSDITERKEAGTGGKPGRRRTK